MASAPKAINVPALSGIGGIAGSLLTTVVQALLANKQHLDDRAFQEKKEAYVGFLEAGHRSEIQRNLEASIHWAYWQNRCDLVASPGVIKLIQEIKDTNPINGREHPDRPDAARRLKEAMRKDLGVATRSTKIIPFFR